MWRLASQNRFGAVKNWRLLTSPIPWVSTVVTLMRLKQGQDKYTKQNARPATATGNSRAEKQRQGRKEAEKRKDPSRLQLEGPIQVKKKKKKWNTAVETASPLQCLQYSLPCTCRRSSRDPTAGLRSYFPKKIRL